MPVNIVPANQKAPAHYLNRKFAISFNLPKLGKLADAARSFPNLGQTNSLALATLAATRVDVALRGIDQAVAGADAAAEAAWRGELAAARVELTDAQAAVSAAFPLFASAGDVYAKLDAAHAGVIPAPAALAADWAG